METTAGNPFWPHFSEKSLTVNIQWRVKWWKPKKNSLTVQLTIIHSEVNQAMKNAALNYKITAYQRKRRVSNLKAAHLQQLKSTKLINAECILSVYKGGTIYRPTSFWHESSVISFSGNYFLRWAPNHPWVVELSACVQRKLVLNAQYRPKLSSLTTAPTDALNLQRTKLLSTHNIKGWWTFFICQNGTVRFVPLCPRILTYSTLLHSPSPRKSTMLKSLKLPRR